MSQSQSQTPDKPSEAQIPEPTAPVSRRKQKRVLDRRINEKAVEIDQQLRASIQEGAGELDILPTQLAQRFAVVAPIGEQRKPSWWNGLVADRSAAWEAEYKGQPREYLGWVSRRIVEKGENLNLTDEQKEEYMKYAATTRAENKEAKAATVTRAKAVSAVSKELASIYEQLQRLNQQVGVEFALFVTRGAIEDKLDPFYASSDKAATFLQGHLSLPAKDMLTMMDLWMVGGVGQMSSHMKGKREALRQSVRFKLNASFCNALKSLGQDTTTFRHIKYSNYNKLVYAYKIILRGYPLTLNGQMVRPSDFQGGIKGLTQADEHLGSGTWGFEAINNTVYEEWKSRYDSAKERKQPTPSPPHIPVPGTEYKLKGEAGAAEGSKIASKRKASSGQEEKKAKKKRSGGSKANLKAKSKEIIDDSENEEEIVFNDSTSDEESSLGEESE
ncbi:hypothetical protein FRC07_002994 [Ceratobasidium sp. 392]|nr:hypothetical protein FRC07_002994 [Ceratobasidium sp. 392]